jgi:hypothetical protein
MEKLIELLQEIQDLAGAGIEALKGALGEGGGEAPEGGAPEGGAPEGGGEAPGGPPPGDEPPA